MWIVVTQWFACSSHAAPTELKYKVGRFSINMTLLTELKTNHSSGRTHGCAPTVSPILPLTCIQKRPVCHWVDRMADQQPR